MLEPLGHQADLLHGGQVERASDLGVAMSASEGLDAVEQQAQGLGIVGGVEEAEIAARQAVALVGGRMAVRRGPRHGLTVAQHDQGLKLAAAFQQRVLLRVEIALQIRAHR
ncbi:hypothetical protein D3C71_1852810 [compost metagenome]